ncbi:MAG: hypothetical protein K0S14_1860 [Thermomicrobiales bacterium]|nr:hypothetical protein [Thermomicrobiales bacterium]
MTVTGTRSGIGGAVASLSPRAVACQSSPETNTTPSGSRGLRTVPTAPTRPSRPVAGLRRQTESANPPMTTKMPTRPTAMAQISARLTKTPCASSNNTYDPATSNARPESVNKPSDGRKTSAKKSRNATRMSSAPRQSKGSCESPTAARMRLMTPSAPGIDVPGLASSKKSPRNPSTRRRYATSGLASAPIAELGEEQEGKMKHVVTPGCCWIEYR